MEYQKLETERQSYELSKNISYERNRGDAVSVTGESLSDMGESSKVLIGQRVEVQARESTCQLLMFLREQKIASRSNGTKNGIRMNRMPTDKGWGWKWKIRSGSETHWLSNQKGDVTRVRVLVQVKKSRDFASTTQNTTKIHTCYTEREWEWHNKW